MAAEPVRHLFRRLAAAWRAPLIRMLVLSASLHAALVAIVQPRPFPAVHGATVLEARLLGAAPVAGRPAPARPVRASVPHPQAAPVAAVPAPPPAAQTEAARPAGETAEALPAAPSALAALPSTGLPELPVLADTAWHEARQLDLPPRLVAGGRPDYPALARRQGVEGTVTLRLRIDEAGNVRELEVAAAEPPGVFEASALAAYRRASFAPGRLGGRPVRAVVYVSVRYALEE